MSHSINMAVGRLHDAAFTSGMGIFRESPEAFAQYTQEVDSFCHNLKSSLNQNPDISEREAVSTVEKMVNSFEENVFPLIKHGVGFIGGAAQIVSGYAITTVSGGILAKLGAVMASYGVNNVYENSIGLYGVFTGEELSVNGPVRFVYRGLVQLRGLDPTWGDVIYDTSDLGLAGFGLFSKTAVKPGTFKLFRFVETDFQRGYQALSKKGMALEVMGDAFTLGEALEKLDEASK